MLIVIGVAVALLLSAVQIWGLHRTATVRNAIVLTLKNVVFLHLLSVAVFQYAFHRQHYLITSSYSAEDFLLYLGICIVSGLLFLLVDCRLRKMTPETAGERGKNVLTGILGVLFVFVGVLCVTLTNWSKVEFGDLPIDQALITYLSPTVGSSTVDIIAAIEGPVFLAFLCASIFGVFAFAHISFLSRRLHHVISLVLSIAILLSGAVYGVWKFQLADLHTHYFLKSTIIDENYIDPRTAHIQFPEKKRNLIHIYLESMENSYMSTENGGFMETDLIPELTQLSSEGYNFSHLNDGFGGPRSAVGTTWSVASMVNMSTGLPMKMPMDKNAYKREDSFLPGAWTLGDILAEEGYEQTLMFGADADFGGLTTYFKTHGNFNIMDYKYAKETGAIPEDYNIWWGYEDEKLFQFAKEELTRLSNTGKPFNFTMETADTHRPDGYLGEDTPTPYPNQYANVVAHSSAQVYDFVRWIQQQPFYDNTTVVIIGDHVSMESNFFKFYGFPKEYRRSQYNVILNPAPGVASHEPQILKNRDYANFDMFPTILSSLGATFDGSRLGVGTDLFSGEKTLFEEKGFQYANRELTKRSTLYDQKIFGDPQ